MKGNEMTDNMRIWNKVCTTDPAITKRVNQRGGFTAIDAQAQVKRATEMFGPYGTTWGVDKIHWSIDDGSAILYGEFYYPDGRFPMVVDAAYKPGNDTMKKLLTDLTTKALSKLGFNSDVFEGKFDDNKYVAQQKQAQQKPQQPTHSAANAPAAVQTEPQATEKKERPLSADDVKAALSKKLSSYAGAAMSDKQRGMFDAVWIYGSLFLDDRERHAATEWLFGFTSSKQLTDAHKLAIIDWLTLEESHEGGKKKYLPSREAITEKGNVIMAALKSQGQQSMEL